MSNRFAAFSPGALSSHGSLEAITKLLREKPELMPGVVRHLQSKGGSLPNVKHFGKKRASAGKPPVGDDGDDDDKHEGGGERTPAASGTSEPAYKVRRTAGVVAASASLRGAVNRVQGRLLAAVHSQRQVGGGGMKA